MSTDGKHSRSERVWTFSTGNSVVYHGSYQKQGNKFAVRRINPVRGGKGGRFLSTKAMKVVLRRMKRDANPQVSLSLSHVEEPHPKQAILFPSSSSTRVVTDRKPELDTDVEPDADLGMDGLEERGRSRSRRGGHNALMDNQRKLLIQQRIVENSDSTLQECVDCMMKVAVGVLRTDSVHTCEFLCLGCDAARSPSRLNRRISGGPLVGTTVAYNQVITQDEWGSLVAVDRGTHRGVSFPPSLLLPPFILLFYTQNRRPSTLDAWFAAA